MNYASNYATTMTKKGFSFSTLSGILPSFGTELLFLHSTVDARFIELV